MDELWKAYLDTRSIKDRDALIEAIYREVFRILSPPKTRTKMYESEVGLQVVIAVSEATEPFDCDLLAVECRTAVNREGTHGAKTRKRLERLTRLHGTSNLKEWWKDERQYR